MRNATGGFAIRWDQETARRYRLEGWWQPTTLVDAARARVAEDSDRVLLIEGERHLTRGQAWREALRLAGFFQRRGLVPGDVVSFQLPNWIESAILALAARMCGLVVNPIPPIYRGSELAYILADCRAKMIFVPQVFRRHDHTAMLAELRGELPALQDIVVVRGAGPLTWDEALSGEPLDETEMPQVDPAAVMMVMYTSGTTGRPKGVMHIHHGFDHRVRAMGEAWNIGPDDTVFMPSPVSHITGAFWAFDMPWVRGSKSVLIDVWAAEDGIRCIEDNACTVSGGATPFLQQLIDVARERPGALSSLRLFFCGGTTVSPELIRAASGIFPQALFFRVYGSTEMTTATLGISDACQAALGAETDGAVRFPVEMRIVDDAGETMPAGDEGEILMRGPGLFVGYLHPSDNDGNFNSDGFFRMGDLGRALTSDAGDEYVVITGRKKDIIIRSGENVSPKEVEDLLYGHPAIAEVAIVAMPSAATGEKGCAFVLPRVGETIDLPSIRAFLDRLGLAKQKYPEHLVVVDDLPRVPSGKIKKDVLRLEARAIAEKEMP
ncbi:AMP-binding protein [uncultured Sphingomonas sp.]|uniref:AMP-binding protein n=1 Tax=uncultured Sphingomonas sp. TaxID=158754 RepID=UPI00260246AC|nr:AMP-binding protein [uncultured Sphingomonas sp.]